MSVFIRLILMNTIIGKSLGLKQSEKINSTVLIFDKQSDYKSKSE